MRQLIVLLLLGIGLSAEGVNTFTEFYVQTTGNNLNAGSTTANTAVYTGVGDSDGTSIFTPSDGSTPASTVSVGDWGSVYITAGATVATFVGRVTAVAGGVNGAVTFSTTAKGGAFPGASAGAHTITLKTGGAWAGPSAAVNFPFGFAVGTMTDASANCPRVNLKNGTTYNITAGLASNKAGPLWYEGYTTSAGDGGRATIDGGAAGASYILLTSSGVSLNYRNLIFANNGATGNAVGLSHTGGNNCLYYGCVVHDIMGTGFNGASGQAVYHECEAYLCDKSNTASMGGFGVANTFFMVRCISHGNTQANASGFVATGAGALSYFNQCIAESNGKNGWLLTAQVMAELLSCDAYNNTGDGIDMSGAAMAGLYAESCNFVKNGGWGINSSGATANRSGVVLNCGFGSGTQANTSGNILTGITGVSVVSQINYAANVTPWVNPGAGDFRVNLATAKNTGRASFTQTAGGYAGTVGYMDVGAAQHVDSGTSFTFAQ